MRTSEITAVVVATILAACTAEAQAQEKGDPKSDQAAFAAMLPLAPAEYQEARKAFVAAGMAKLDFLRQRSKRNANRYEKAIADALILAIEEPETLAEYEKAWKRFVLGRSRGFPWRGGNEGSSEPLPAGLADTPLVKAKEKAAPFLIEKLFTEMPCRIPDASVKGFHWSGPIGAAQQILRYIGGKQAATGMALFLIADGRASKAVGEVGWLSDEQIVDKMIALLSRPPKSPTVEDWNRLSKLRDNRERQCLVTLWRAQAQAAWVLGEMQDPRAIQPLLSSLSRLDSRVTPPFSSDVETGVYYMSAEALVRFGDKAVAPVLKVTATAARHETRVWTKHALGKMGPSVAEIQAKSLKKDAPLSRREAILSIGAVGGEDAVVKALTEVWPGSLTDDRSLDLLMSALTNYDVYLCEPIANALAKAGEAAVPRLKKALDSPTPEVRSWAKHALRKIDEAKAKKAAKTVAQP
jgi:hypothetical protein